MGDEAIEEDAVGGIVLLENADPLGEARNTSHVRDGSIQLPNYSYSLMR